MCMILYFCTFKLLKMLSVEILMSNRYVLTSKNLLKVQLWYFFELKVNFKLYQFHKLWIMKICTEIIFSKHLNVQKI